MFGTFHRVETSFARSSLSSHVNTRISTVYRSRTRVPVTRESEERRHDHQIFWKFVPSRSGHSCASTVFTSLIQSLKRVQLSFNVQLCVADSSVLTLSHDNHISQFVVNRLDRRGLHTAPRHHHHRRPNSNQGVAECHAALCRGNIVVHRVLRVCNYARDSAH